MFPCCHTLTGSVAVLAARRITTLSTIPVLKAPLSKGLWQFWL